MHLPLTSRLIARCLLALVIFPASFLVARCQTSNDFPPAPEAQAGAGEVKEIVFSSSQRAPQWTQLSPRPQPSFSRQNWINLALVAGLSASDAISTPRALSRGNSEMILPKDLATSSAGMWGLAVARVSLQAWGTTWLNRRGHQRAALWVERGHVALMLPTVHNWFLPQHPPQPQPVLGAQRFGVSR